jgi:Zinc-binding
MLQTASLDQLATHVENKHAGKTFAECFPDRAAAYAARADKK